MAAWPRPSRPAGTLPATMARPQRGQQLVLEQAQEGGELGLGGRAGPLVDDDGRAGRVDGHVCRARLGLRGREARVESLGRERLHDPAPGMPARDARRRHASAQACRSTRGVDALAARQGDQLDGPQDLTVDDAPDMRGPVDRRAGRDAEERRRRGFAGPRTGVGAAAPGRGSSPGTERGPRRAPRLRSSWSGRSPPHHPLRVPRPHGRAGLVRGGRCRTGGRRRRPGRAGCSRAR